VVLKGIQVWGMGCPRYGANASEGAGEPIGEAEVANVGQRIAIDGIILNEGGCPCKNRGGESTEKARMREGCRGCGAVTPRPRTVRRFEGSRLRGAGTAGSFRRTAAEGRGGAPNLVWDEPVLGIVWSAGGSK